MIPVARPALKGREKELVADCVASGWVSSKGKYIPAFEEAFAAFVDVPGAVAASNGTTALHLALLAARVGPGDEVIVPSLTFIATANAVVYCGARPVFVDSEPVTYNLDPAQVERALTPATKAVVAVHLYGHPADMQALSDLCRAKGVALVEDAAEAPGAACLVDGEFRQVGSMGLVSAFSFFGNKIFTTGEGGMVTSRDQKLLARVRMLRDHGMDPARPYWHPVVGYNYRMTNMQAALGVAQMERAAETLAGKVALARAYDQALAGIDGLTPPPAADWARSVYWMYAPLVTPAFPLTRDELARALLRRGVETRPFFHPAHLMPPYDTGQNLPVAARLAATGICLPGGPDITPQEVETVCRALAEVAEAGREALK